MIKKIFPVLATFILFGSNQFVSAAPSTTTTNAVEQTLEKPLPPIVGEYGVAIDAISGEVYYGKNEHTQAYPASITKVLTAILVDELLEDNEVITISANAALQEPSNGQLLFKEGETITKKEALETILLISSNDVSFALAEHVSGSVEEFSNLMNRRAEELGAQNSHFITPNGLPNAEHKTTAYDMAIIGRELLNRPLLMEILSKKEATISVRNETFTIKAPHSIFELNPNALGGKTGWTNASANTLLEVLEKDGQHVVSVVMKTTLKDEYIDINTMSDFAFANFNSKMFFNTGDSVLKFEINRDDANLIATEPIFASYKTGEKIQNKIVWESKSNFINGETAAWLVLLNNAGDELKRFPLSIDRSVHISDEVKLSLVDKNIIEIDFSKIFLIFGLIVFIPFVLFFILYQLTHRKPKTKKISKK